MLDYTVVHSTSTLQVGSFAPAFEVCEFTIPWIAPIRQILFYFCEQLVRILYHRQIVERDNSDFGVIDDYLHVVRFLIIMNFLSQLKVALAMKIETLA